MVNKAEYLFEILKKEHQLCQEINKLAEEKQEILINEDIDRLAEIVKSEEKNLEKIKELEGERLEISNGKKMSEISKLLIESERKKFADLSKELLALTIKLKEQNLLNNKLIEDSLHLTNMSLNLAKGNSGTNTYDKKGVVKRQGSNFINKKA